MKRLVILLTIIGAGCESHVSTETQALSERMAFGDPERQVRFTKALSNAQIPFKIVTIRSRVLLQDKS